MSIEYPQSGINDAPHQGVTRVPSTMTWRHVPICICPIDQSVEQAFILWTMRYTILYQLSHLPWKWRPNIIGSNPLSKHSSHEGRTTTRVSPERLYSRVSPDWCQPSHGGMFPFAYVQLINPLSKHSSFGRCATPYCINVTFALGMATKHHGEQCVEQAFIP